MVTKKGTLKQYLKKRWGIKIALICIAALLCGILCETAYELNTYRRELKGDHQAGMEVIPQESIKITLIEKGEEENSQDEVLEGEEELTKRIHITLKERYINKLRYSYKTDHNITPEITVTDKDIYKNPQTRQVKDIVRPNLQKSILNIKSYVTEITFEVPESMDIHTFIIDNSWDFNWYRVAYISTFVMLLFIIFCFRELLGRKIEYGFLIISISCGLLFIAIQPPECVSWDEHIHIGKAFDWFDDGVTERSISEQYLYDNAENVDRAPFLSKEEKSLQIQYLNENADTTGGTYERNRFSLASLGYMHMGIIIKIAELLGASFYVQFILGKAANLILYGVLMFFAIRITPVGKKLLAVAGLMPTMLLQSVSYTYDVVVTGFLILGFSLLLSQFFEYEKKLSVGKAVLIPLIFIIGSCPKAVYIPMLAITLALPRNKFKSFKGMVLYKGLIVLLCLAMMMTFMIPAAGGGMEGDVRGGNTDVTSQMLLIFAHPISYARVLWQNFYESSNSFVIGADGLASIAYAGSYPFNFAVPALVLGVALTEKKKKLGLSVKNTRIFKGMLFLVLAAVVVLIWTALYLSFTPVGSINIAGVQPRYYIPLLLPFFMIFYTDKVEAKWKDSSYNMIILLLALWLAHESMYSQYFLEFCQ